jgi:hypothetical protein
MLCNVGTRKLPGRFSARTCHLFRTPHAIIVVNVTVFVRVFEVQACGEVVHRMGGGGPIGKEISVSRMGVSGKEGGGVHERHTNI